MSTLAWVSGIPEIMSAVVGDMSGAVTDVAGDPEGETTAAISGFAATSLTEVGEALGLGSLEGFSVAGKDIAVVVTVMGGMLITTRVDPAKPLAAVEKKLASVLRG